MYIAAVPCTCAFHTCTYHLGTTTAVVRVSQTALTVQRPSVRHVKIRTTTTASLPPCVKNFILFHFHP